MRNSSANFPTSTLKSLLENTELADHLFNNFPLFGDDDECEDLIGFFFSFVIKNLFSVLI